MSQLTVVAVGRIKNSLIRGLEEEYIKRVERYASLKLIEVSDSRQKNSERKTWEEGEILLKEVGRKDFLIILDEQGLTFSSHDLAKNLQDIKNRGLKILFMVGGAYGLSAAVKQRGNLCLSLSTLTWPHELARVLLLEQILRAHTILKGEKYHH